MQLLLTQLSAALNLKKRYHQSYELHSLIQDVTDCQNWILLFYVILIPASLTADLKPILHKWFETFEGNYPQGNALTVCAVDKKLAKPKYNLK